MYFKLQFVPLSGCMNNARAQRFCPLNGAPLVLDGSAFTTLELALEWRRRHRLKITPFSVSTRLRPPDLFESFHLFIRFQKTPFGCPKTPFTCGRNAKKSRYFEKI